MAVRRITSEDKVLIAGTLHAAGLTYRLRVFPHSIRAVIDGVTTAADRDAVAAALNAGGFRFAAGQLFTRFSIDGNQAFIHGVAI